MSNHKYNVQRYPLVWFYVISVLIEIAIIPLFFSTGADQILFKALEKTGIPFKTDLISAFKLILAAPETLPAIFLSITQVAAVDIAVIIVVKLAYGNAGITDLKSRFRFWKQDILWQNGLKKWSICIFTFSLINLASAWFNKSMFPALFVWDVNVLPIAFLISLIITLFLDAGGLFEENGWRGFALPLLLQRLNPVQASIYLGILWGVWHFPVKYNVFLSYGFTEGAIYLLTFTLRLVFVSIIMTYFWNQLGQTTIIAIAMHGLINDSIGLGGRIESENFIPQLFTEINLLLPTAVVAVILLIRTKGKLGFNI
ncbi:CAAX protease family protein [Calothrix sp. HK-06]|nr:CAAX protease family protein [Calothrix sp. HK-06]